MREDLLDAEAAVQWAIAQRQLLEQRFKSWLDNQPYYFFFEPHPEIGKKLIKLRVLQPLPPIAVSETGAIIGSLRSALDMLASSLARRNGIKPSADTHFPFFATEYDFIDPKDGLEAKK